MMIVRVFFFLFGSEASTRGRGCRRRYWHRCVCVCVCVVNIKENEKNKSKSENMSRNVESAATQNIEEN